MNDDILDKFSLSMYENKPCCICGENITNIFKSVCISYSADGKLCLAHKTCWEQGKPKSEWAFPLDCEDE